jgi:hypothetical protein
MGGMGRVIWGRQRSSLARGAFDGNRFVDLQQTISFNKATGAKAMGSEFSASIQEGISKG